MLRPRAAAEGGLRQCARANSRPRVLCCAAQQQRDASGAAARATLPAEAPRQQQQPPAAPRAPPPQPAAAPGPPTVWIPVSGPPGAPVELRRMVHPADAEGAAPTSLADVASPQQLAIGKREAREQAAALAAAQTELDAVRLDAARVEGDNRDLVALVAEVQQQRDEGIRLVRELVAGYKALETEHSRIAGQLAHMQGSYDGLKQAFMDLLADIETEVADPSGGGGGGGGGGLAGNAKFAGAAAALAQLTQMSQHIARESLRGEERRREVARDVEGVAGELGGGSGAGDPGLGGGLPTGAGAHTARGAGSGGGGGTGGTNGGSGSGGTA